MTLDRLRQVCEDARARRGSMSDAEREHYSLPAEGAFVGAHTGFVVVPHQTLSALLDVAELAAVIQGQCASWVWEDLGGGIRRAHVCGGCRFCRLQAALARLRTLTGEDQT